MNLADDVTHFSCEGCNKLKLVEEVHKARVAYSVFNNVSQDKFIYRPYWIMLCNKCFECKEEDKKDD